MECWMNRLARHHGVMRLRYPEDRLLVVFDIDDTILDLRHMILHVLRSFDRCHETGYFRHLFPRDIGVGENEIERMTAELCLSAHERRRVEEWFRKHSWSASVVAHAHRPFPGAMDVIRWMQSQSHTSVGLNTGRPEAVRKETLDSLNGLGRFHGVVFHDDLLFMSRYDWGQAITRSKVEGIRCFQERGYRIVGFVDNEPENLCAVAEFDRREEILLLHADTTYSSGRDMIPPNAVSGKVYNVSRLAGERRGYGGREEAA